MNSFMYGFLDELEKAASLPRAKKHGGKGVGRAIGEMKTAAELGRALQVQEARIKRGLRARTQGLFRGRGKVSGPAAAPSPGKPSIPKAKFEPRVPQY